MQEQRRTISMKMGYSPIGKRSLLLAALMFVWVLGSSFAHSQAIAAREGAAFSNGYVAGNTLYVAGQQGHVPGKQAADLDITAQTTAAIAAVQKVVEQAGFKMTDIVNVTVYVTSLDDVPAMNVAYIKLMPDPKPARATVQVAGLIGGGKIEISAIAVKK
jgi:2-iminobutanoate/2-iminopropanoate deaminase